jgi:hypothetical protein
MKTIPKNMPGIPGRSGTLPDHTSNHQHIPGAGFFNKTFGINGNNTSLMKKVSNALINQAMVGSYPNTNISYPGLIRSNGPLPGPDSPNAVVNYDGSILFSWSDNSGIKIAKSNDKVILVTYFPATNKIIHTLHAATRRSCQALLHVNKMNGFAVETWIGFVSDDERDAADSVYAGRVIL